MSSNENLADAMDSFRVVYRSSNRVVVTGAGRVAEIAAESGWVRSIGTAGPMSGELISSCSGGVWYPRLSPADAELVRRAIEQASEIPRTDQ